MQSNQVSLKSPIDFNIVAIDWFDKKGGCYDYDSPSLAIAFENGLCKLYKGIKDTNPIILKTNLTISNCKWCPNGRFIALSGSSNDKDKMNDISKAYTVNFFNTSGALIHSLSFPLDEEDCNNISVMNCGGMFFLIIP